MPQVSWNSPQKTTTSWTNLLLKFTTSPPQVHHKSTTTCGHFHHISNHHNLWCYLWCFTLWWNSPHMFCSVPRQYAIMGYAPAGMHFNSVSTCHTSDTFHVCYEVMSVNMVEPRSAMRDSNQQNTGKSVDCESVMEQSVAGAAEWSGIKKNKGKIAISSQSWVSGGVECLGSNGMERNRKIGEKQRKNSNIIASVPLLTLFPLVFGIWHELGWILNFCSSPQAHLGPNPSLTWSLPLPICHAPFHNDVQPQVSQVTHW